MKLNCNTEQIQDWINRLRRIFRIRIVSEFVAEPVSSICKIQVCYQEYLEKVTTFVKKKFDEIVKTLT